LYQGTTLELAEKLGSANLSVRLANFEVIVCLTFCGAEGTSTFAVRDEGSTKISSFSASSLVGPQMIENPSGFKPLALPALKRMIKIETLSRSAKALLPPHKCGGFHHESHGLPVLTQTL
jgi:hypothetical protein